MCDGWNFTLSAALKLVNVTHAHAEKHYEDLSSKPFFAGLVEYSTYSSEQRALVSAVFLQLALSLHRLARRCFVLSS